MSVAHSPAPEASGSPPRHPLVSIVVPAYNEAAGIQVAVRRFLQVLDGLPYRAEVLVIDDGSEDGTFVQAAALTDEGLPVRVLHLSRHFGKEAAILAGLRHARGNAVVTIDADLQHPPELIPTMLTAWERGARVVHAVKRDRGDEPWTSTVRARVVNALILRLGGVDVRSSSDFKLLDRMAADVLTQGMPERRRFYRGLADWIGFNSVALEFDVAPRASGRSAWRLRSLIALALTALMSFTSVPLRVVSILGILTFLLGVGVGADALVSWARGRAVSGFATLIISLLLIGSFIMISLGVIGEYIAKIYDEIKQRPTYIVDRSHEVDMPSPRLDEG
jgi:polyisoprenyl-phosphate glycosyltransferase